MNDLIKQENRLPQKTATKRAVTHPITLLPMIGSVSSFIAGVVLESFLWGFLGFMLLSTTITLFIALSIFFKISNSVQSREKKSVGFGNHKELGKSLKSSGDSVAVKQLSHINDSFYHFEHRLSDRIGRDTPEYDQYLSPAKEMYDAAIRNLEAISRFHKDISVAHVKDAKEAIKRLERSGEATVKELEVHKRKIAIARESEQKITELKKEVDSAITVLIDVSNQLNDIVSDRNEVQKSAKTAIEKFNKTADLNRRINEKVKTAWDMMK